MTMGLSPKYENKTYPGPIQETELSFKARLSIKCFGTKFMFREGMLDYSASYCEKHGYFISEHQGYDDRVTCPGCYFESMPRQSLPNQCGSFDNLLVP
jgi:hypothetical protein